MAILAIRRDVQLIVAFAVREKASIMPRRHLQ